MKPKIKNVVEDTEVQYSVAQYSDESWQMTGLEEDTSPIAPLTPETFRLRLESLTQANRDLYALQAAMPHNLRPVADKST